MPDLMPMNSRVLAELDYYEQQHRRLERYANVRVELDGPVLVRLDGRAFHTLTKDMERPFDERFEAAMDAVCEALMKAQLGVRACYVQSDEVSVLIDELACPFDARHEKLTSIAASLAASVFSLALGRVAMFDARTIETSSPEQALAVLAERQLDASKNAVTQLAHWTLVRQQGMTGRQAERTMRPLKLAQRRELCTQLGVPVSSMPDWRVYGRLCHYHTVQHAGVNPLTGERVPTLRRRLTWQRPAPDFRRMYELPGVGVARASSV